MWCLRFVTSTLCAATFSNSYTKWRLRYVMLHFLAVPKQVLRVFLLVIHSHLYSFALTFPALQNHATSYSFCKGGGGKPDRKPCPLPYGWRNPYRNLKSENSQDYAQKPQWNRTFMNSPSDPFFCKLSSWSGTSKCDLDVIYKFAHDKMPVCNKCSICVIKSRVNSNKLNYMHIFSAMHLCSQVCREGFIFLPCNN